MSKLYIVGTPIGNLGDFSPRGVETLNKVDFICAEDTRLSRGLLTHFNISTPMVSYHEHNKKQRGEEIVQRILNGESCGIITDAGMPAISDPGEDLVNLCHENGIEVVAVPGPTAVTTAVALSGMNTRQFLFLGFLDGKDSEKKTQLLQVKNLPYTLVFYESPHHLLATLKIMLEVLGDRQVAFSREITKMYEEVLRLKISEGIDHFTNTPPRGEFVLVIEGFEQTDSPSLTFDEAVEMVLERSKTASLSSSAKEVADITGFKRSKLYKGALQAENKQ